MNEGRLLFTLDYEQFMKNWGENILSFLQNEFDRSNISLSRSLLFYTKNGDSSWSLADFENKKTYDISKENETTIEISERSNPIIGTIFPSLRDGIGTHTGIIDALKLLNFNLHHLENLKRSDLLARKLSFESVYPDVEVAYGMLYEILNVPRTELISLPSKDVQQLKDNVIQSYEMTEKIMNFGRGDKDENIREQHDILLREIQRFCDRAKNSLLHIVAYLSSRTNEEFKNQVKATLTAEREKLNTTIDSITDRIQKIEETAHQNEKKRQAEHDEIILQLKNQLVSQQLEKYKIIFQKQAKKHEKMAWIWLGATVALAAVFGLIFWRLLTDLGSAVSSISQLSTVLSNLFVRGFYISLVFLFLNRTNKNYAAEKHLEVINTHRQNALETFEAFAESAGSTDTREQVLLSATKTIFDTNLTGYLSAKASSSDSSGPIQHFIKETLPSKSSSKNV